MQKVVLTVLRIRDVWKKFKRKKLQFCKRQKVVLTVLRIRDVYPGSDFFLSRIRTVSFPDLGSGSATLVV
jgi:hypothetical protein